MESPDPTRPVAVTFVMGRTGYVDAARGEVLGEGSWPVRSFFRIVSGLYIWVPRRWTKQHLRAGLVLAS